MSNANQRWMVGALGVLLLTVLYGCLVGRGGGGYVGGGYYDEPYGPGYGGWGRGYHVAPPRGGERRPEQPHAYRPAPRTRPAPSLPTRPYRP